MDENEKEDKRHPRKIAADKKKERKNFFLKIWEMVMDLMNPDPPAGMP
jgi:hypothetical protein